MDFFELGPHWDAVVALPWSGFLKKQELWFPCHLWHPWCKFLLRIPRHRWGSEALLVGGAKQCSGCHRVCSAGHLYLKLCKSDMWCCLCHGAGKAVLSWLQFRALFLEEITRENQFSSNIVVVGLIHRRKRKTRTATSVVYALGGFFTERFLLPSSTPHRVKSKVYFLTEGQLGFADIRH